MPKPTAPKSSVLMPPSPPKPPVQDRDYLRLDSELWSKARSGKYNLCFIYITLLVSGSLPAAFDYFFADLEKMMTKPDFQEYLCSKYKIPFKSTTSRHQAYQNMYSLQVDKDPTLPTLIAKIEVVAALVPSASYNDSINLPDHRIDGPYRKFLRNYSWLVRNSIETATWIKSSHTAPFGDVTYLLVSLKANSF